MATEKQVTKMGAHSGCGLSSGGTLSTQTRRASPVPTCVSFPVSTWRCRAVILGGCACRSCTGLTTRYGAFRQRSRRPAPGKT